ncbi:hypothetical protein HN51_070608 [Arachis hypogaea]|uniref:Uncharacterized protein n=1 Tax=Arachis hypogaea TaxID=3818 RepID=A0A444Z1B6_ARAHY|nr:E3 ubiquitin-protein ligase [Arachis hypogaea]RYR07965.1 hypothetical protein Ahy_B05g075466 [Arachis hypogaea]
MLCCLVIVVFKPVFDLSFSYYAIHAAELSSDDTLFYFTACTVLAVFAMATSLRMYTACQHLQAQARAHAAATTGWLNHTELWLHVPPSIEFVLYEFPNI